MSVSGGEKAEMQDRAKDGPEPLSPPLVDVVDGPVDLLAPAFKLGDVAQVFKREGTALRWPSAPSLKLADSLRSSCR